MFSRFKAIGRERIRQPRPLPKAAIVCLWLSPIIIVSLLVLRVYGALLATYIDRIDWSKDKFWVEAFYSTGALYDAAVISVNTLRSMTERHDIPVKSDLPTIRLNVELGSLEKMVAAPPGQKKRTYYNAKLMYPDGNWQPVKYRFRGRNVWHWQPDKPSLRLKLKKNLPIDNQRHINLINPEDRPMIANLYGETLAGKMGVLTHSTKFVRLFINDKFSGVYHWTTREDESLLIKKQRIPGPLFIGDNLGYKWHADQFETVGKDDILKKFNPMERLVSAMYTPLSAERYRNLWGILSKEKYAGWVAVNNLVSSIHSDWNHNNLFYFDPSTGLIEPVISDMLGHGVQLFPLYKYRIWQDFVPFPKVPLNERMQPLMEAVLGDPTFYDLRNQQLFNALTSFGSTQQQISDLSNIYKKIDADVNADPYKTALQNTFIGDYPIPYSNAQFHDAKQTLFDWIGKRKNYLLGELEKSQVSASITTDENTGDVTLMLAISGNSAVIFDPSKISGEVFADKDLNGSISHHAAKPMRLFPGLKVYAGTNWDLWTYGDKRHLIPGVQKYLFKVKSTSLKQLESELPTAFQNAITHSSVSPTFNAVSRIDTRNYVVSEASLHAWQLYQKPIGSVTLGPGTVDIKTDLYIGKYQTLTIKPGTQIKLAKGISILSEGKVLIEGSIDQPVIFERLDPDEAWGGLAFQGPGTSGSRVKHATFRGGTNNTHSTIFYSGMVSVHHAVNVVFEDSKFAGNTLSDDTLHIVNSDVTLANIKFSDCFSDCMDLDYSRAEMNNIQIVRAGNDGIDFMGTDATVHQLSIDGANDKGLSVGEKSNVRISSASIEQASTGIAVKDASQARIDMVKLSQSEIAIDVYIKHKIYGTPGTITASNVRFSNNEVNIRNQSGGIVLFQSQKVPDKISGDGRTAAVN